MKTLKFMLAAATAIGLASATQAAVDQLASTSFETLAQGTSVTTGVKDHGNVQEGSYFYYAGSVAADNESVIAEGTPEIARPRGAVDNSRTNILQVSTGTDPLLRTYLPIGNNGPQTATLAGDVYVDTLVQFTVTPSTDTVTPGSADKLMIYLKESVETNEFGEVTSTDTNLVVVGGYCVADGEFEAKEYVVQGADIEPNTWHRLTVKVIANYGELDGYQHPAFQVFLDGDDNPCVFDSYAAAEDETDTGFVAPFDSEEPGALGTQTVVFSLLCTGDQAATLQGVGFAGEGKVDDIVFNTSDPFAALLDFTLAFDTTAGVSAVTYTVGGVQYDQARTFTDIEPATVVEITSVTYATDYMADSVTPVNMTNTEGSKYTVDAAGATLTVTATLGGASAGDTTYATLAEALSAATAGQTVKLIQDATVSGNTITTAAGTLDLNGKTLTLPQNASQVASLTFTGTGAATLKGGDLTGIYHELTITAPAGENLTFDGMTFHASVKPAGSGDLFTVTNCQFLCDFDKTGAAFTDGSTADVHSYGVLFFGDSLFTQADIVNSTFDQGRRACVQASFAGDLYFYGNTVVADKLTSRKDGASTRYPALQIFSNGRVFIENNTFSGQYLGEAFLLYNKTGYRTTDAAVVFSGNTVADGVNYLWGIYDADASATPALTNACVYFGANTVGGNVDTTGCIYKTTTDGLDMNGINYSHTPVTLALPAGVDSVYAWTHAAGATDFYVNGTAAADLTSVAANDTVIAVPGATVTEPAAILLTADAPLKNQFTAATAVAKNGATKYATFKAAVEGASAGDTVEILGDCTESGMVTITAGITITNDYTVALSGMYALRFANGSTPVTICGAGTLAGSGEGSPLLIGSNETTKNAKYEITTTYEGSVTLDGNTITYSGSGNVIKLENGTFTMNSGTVTAGGNRGVKADADVGNFTSTVIINGGTITSTKAAVASSASADTGKTTSGTANVTINGGEITGPLTCGQNTSGTATLVIPGTSTAKFDRDQSAFCASGYETTLSEGWYVVTAVTPSGEDIEPGQQSTTTYDSQAAAEAALANVTIVAADDIATNENISAANKDAYLAMFEKKVVSAGEGQYKVEVGLTAAATTALQAEVDADAAEVIEDLSESNVTLTTTPGFYYSFEYGTTLDNMAEVGPRTLATGSELTLPRPTTANATAGFYKVLVNVVPATVTP